MFRPEFTRVIAPLIVAFVVAIAATPVDAAERTRTAEKLKSMKVPTLRLVRGHSHIIPTRTSVTSIAIGNPGVAAATAVSPKHILLNALAPGSTTMSLIHSNNRISVYRVHVSHDLQPLQAHLHRLDKRIEVLNDPNGDAIILQGEAASRDIVEKAVEAAYRFVGEVSVEISTNPRARRERGGTAPDGTGAGVPQGVVGVEGELSPINETITQGETRVINLLVTDDLLVPAARRLETVLKKISPDISVDEVNRVFVLRGVVPTPAALARALAIADRFVNPQGKLDIKVLSDHGGVLAGEDEVDLEEAPTPIIDPLIVPQIGIGTPGGLGRTGGTRNNSLNNNQAGGTLPVEISPAKGNLGQNVSRAGVISVADGRVISLLTVAKQPRVELKLNIVAIDRSKADEIGVSWRIDGSNVSVTTTGDAVSTPPNNPSTTLGATTPGGLNAAAKVLTGATTIQAFVRAIETTGVGEAVSEPTLTAVSGEAAAFLVGGNLPIPVQTTVPGTPTSNPFTTTNVAYIEFGLRIVARPTVLENGRISIVLDQMLSEPDDDSAIIINGARIPGFKQRSVRTVTESHDGETWAVAGLVSDQDISIVSGVPVLKDLPILGALFRTRITEKDRTELMITVTAYRIDDDQSDPAARNTRRALQETYDGKPAAWGTE